MKRERELSERQKDNPPLDLPSDHPLRKLISRFRKKSDRNLLSPSADLELGETSSCMNPLDEHAPKRKSASAETINSDLQNTYNCSAALARRGTLMPGAVPSASTRQGSWYQKRGSGAGVQRPASQQDTELKVDLGRTSEDPGKLGVPGFEMNLESAANRAEESSGGPEVSKKGEQPGVTRPSLSCSKRPASKWGRLLSGGTGASATNDTTTSAVSSTSQPIKEKTGDDTQLARDLATCVAPKTVNRRLSSKDMSKVPTAEQVTTRKLTGQTLGKSQSEETSQVSRPGTEPGAWNRDGGACRGEPVVDGSLELHVCEILRDLKSEILGVHQRIQKVEAHLEDVFRLFQHPPSAVGGSTGAAGSLTSPNASLSTSPRELSLKSPCYPPQNPAFLLPISTDESQVPPRFIDSAISVRVLDDTGCVQRTSTKDENSHHSSRSSSDSKPPVLFPRKPSTRSKSRSPSGSIKLYRKRAPPSPIPGLFPQNLEASSSAIMHESSVTSVDEPLLLEYVTANSAKIQTEVEAEDSPLTSGLPEVLETDDFRNGEPLDSTASTSNQNLTNDAIPGETTTNSTCGLGDETHSSTADKDSL